MTRRTAARRPTHPFTADPGVTDWRNQPLCGYPGCGQPAGNRAHQLPDNPAADLEARRLGEKGDTDA